EFILDKISDLWQSGLEINWPHLQSQKAKHKISLPTYPFEKIKYPLGKGMRELLTKALSNGIQNNKNEQISDWFYELSWKQSRLISSLGEISEGLNYLVFCDTCGIAKGLVERILVNKNASAVLVIIGADFVQIS
ncbi:MAG: hypothetical protein Q8K92_26330, partial [Leadbetterella sp.]|nr:hypothetical protein [Leadbetterella sp.]